jgi:hypothetical protein
MAVARLLLLVLPHLHLTHYHGRHTARAHGRLLLLLL